MPTQAGLSESTAPVFVFAYGSLIWRPDFEYTEAYQAVVHGYERRFWQASHDHRGTPQFPGRVVTMVPVKHGRCEGLVYRVPDSRRDAILSALDEREQDGYERVWLNAQVTEGGTSFKVLTWLAAAGNPSWAGDATVTQVATLIASRHGHSGTNREYLLRLHSAFEQLGIRDDHVADLALEVKKIQQ